MHGKRHGRGVSVFASGSRFEGDFQDDKQHGQGTYTWADGDKYEGDLRLAVGAVLGVIGTGALAILATSAL